MSDYNQNLFAPTLRYDTIAGHTTGPFNDPVNSYFKRMKRLTNGTVTPNYGYKRAHKIWLPENIYTLEEEHVKFPWEWPFLKLIWIPTGDYSTYYGPCRNGTGALTYLEPTQSQIDAAVNLVRIKLLEQIQGQKVHLGNFYAQRHQMIHEFVSSAKRIAKAFKSLKRGNIKGALEALACPPSKYLNPFKSAASNWLALQYGWLPLLSDLYGMSQELDQSWKERLEKPIFQLASAKRRLSDSDVWLNPPGDLTNDHRGASAGRGYISDFRGRVNYTVDVQDAHLLSELGLSNPLAIAWEVLPYSFVVDWFAPVGRWVNTLDATLGCHFLSGTMASTVNTVFRWSNKSTFVDGNFKYIYYGCDGYGRRFVYKRAPLVGFPVVHLPQLKDPVSKAHVLNALALLSQAFFLNH